MKVTINVDCTPEEARAFMGLPPVADAQQAIVDAWKRRTLEAMEAMDPQTLFQSWLSGGAMSGSDAWDQFQKAFWAGMPDTGATDKK